MANGRDHELIPLHRLWGLTVAPKTGQQAREKNDALLSAAGWHVCDTAAANIHAARGVAIRDTSVFLTRDRSREYASLSFLSYTE